MGSGKGGMAFLTKDKCLGTHTEEFNTNTKACCIYHIQNPEDLEKRRFFDGKQQKLKTY